MTVETSSIYLSDPIEKASYGSHPKPLKKNKRHKDNWKAWIPLLEQVSFQNCVQVLLWDVAANQFIYSVDKRGVAGHNAALYLGDHGTVFFSSNFHPLFHTASHNLLYKGYDYLLQNKHEVYNTIVNADFVCLKSKGYYMHCLLQSKCVETDIDGNPTLILNFRHDITHLKKENTVNMVIATPTCRKWWNYNFVHHSLQEVRPFSKQEKKVLACLSTGQASTDIAKKLCLSPHTVDTHRRHLLYKTNCLNTTGMITYAKLVSLL